MIVSLYLLLFVNLFSYIYLFIASFNNHVRTSLISFFVQNALQKINEKRGDNNFSGKEHFKLFDATDYVEQVT